MRIALVVIFSLIIAGCQTRPIDAPVIAQPKTPVVKTVTNFTQALTCMDRLFVRYDKRDIRLTTDGAKDQSNKITADTQAMMINALSMMSKQSKAFAFIDAEFTETMKIFEDFTKKPQFYIKGSISSIDQGVTTDARSVGINTSFIGLGGDDDQMTTVVSVDLALFTLPGREILPGQSVNNSIVITRKGKSISAEGLTSQGSLVFNFSKDRNEGTGAAIRTLIEYSMIELLGRWTQVPYSQCLEAPGAQPETMMALRESYHDLDSENLIAQIQEALRASGEYSGPLDSVMNRNFQSAVNRAKRARGLNPNGRVDAQFYQLLATEGWIKEQAAMGNPLDGVDPLGLELVLPEKTWRVGDVLYGNLSVKSDSYVYCYYRYVDTKDKGQVLRIFPSKPEQSAFLRAGTQMRLPAENAGFKLKVGGKNRETLACIARSDPYTPASEPSVLRQPPLKPLANDGLIDPIIQQHTKADPERTSVVVRGINAVD